MKILAWSIQGAEAVETECHVNRLFIDVISFDIFVASACVENQKFGMDSAAELGFVFHHIITVLWSIVWGMNGFVWVDLQPIFSLWFRLKVSHLRDSAKKHVQSSVSEA